MFMSTQAVARTNASNLEKEKEIFKSISSGKLTEDTNFEASKDKDAVIEKLMQQLAEARRQNSVAEDQPKTKSGYFFKV